MLWMALRLRLRGGAPGVFYIGGSDTMPAPLGREAEQQAAGRMLDKLRVKYPQTARKNK